MRCLIHHILSMFKTLSSCLNKSTSGDFRIIDKAAVLISEDLSNATAPGTLRLSSN
jgi:hypothetical protein